MDIFYSKKLLDILIENSIRILAAGFGVNRTESTFFDIIKLIGKDEFLKEYFLDKVRITFSVRAPEHLVYGLVPIELIELVAHEFRWPELEELAKQRIRTFFGNNATLAISDISRRLSEAYHDDWQDREFYERYNN